jgi:hypothetical protein
MGGQIDRHERTEAGLHIGDAEDEPVERTAARLRRARRCCAFDTDSQVRDIARDTAQRTIIIL